MSTFFINSFFFFLLLPFSCVPNLTFLFNQTSTMLASVATVFINAQRKILFEFIPRGIRNVWKDWEVRVLILLSLVVQIILIWFGNKRKYMRKFRVRVTVWSAYLLADWVATVALGVIAQNTLDDCPRRESEKLQYELMAFWAPFLLIHLGGPDTITAYSLEDNELWLRHLVGLVIHSGLAFYVSIVAWPGSSYLIPCSLLILLSGVIKYTERTLALRSANFEYLANSMLTPPDAGPNYAKFMEEFTLKKMEGFFVEAAEVKELPIKTDPNKYPQGRGQLISEAFDQFEIFKRLFVDLILSFQDKDNSRKYFERLGKKVVEGDGNNAQNTEEDAKDPEEAAKKAFDVIGIELSFAFDMFFTKAPIIYTAGCSILRLITSCFTFVSMITFLLLCETKKYQVADVVVTYLLFVVAIFLEIYAIYVLVISDWMDHWLSKHKKTRKVWISKCLQPSEKPRWSVSMSQYNLLRFCLEDKPACCYKIQEFFHISDFLEKHRYRTYVDVSSGLKTQIFNRFKEFEVNDSDPSIIVKRRGSFTIKEKIKKFAKELAEVDLDWILKMDFDQRILVWHIATDLCYHLDSEETSINCKESKHLSDYMLYSKHLSDYMLYLLVMCPFMLPMGIGMIRFRDTCAEAREFFKERKLGGNISDACKKLMSVNTEVLPAKVKGDRSKSVLFDACRLAKLLLGKIEKREEQQKKPEEQQKKPEEQRKKREEQWEIIFQEWVELAAYAASHCRSNHHAQQLRKGGEFLTHVWLLMAHLGITEQFQISQGHARAKLVVK